MEIWCWSKIYFKIVDISIRPKTAGDSYPCKNDCFWEAWASIQVFFSTFVKCQILWGALSSPWNQMKMRIYWAPPASNSWIYLVKVGLFCRKADIKNKIADAPVVLAIHSQIPKLYLETCPSLTYWKSLQEEKQIVLSTHLCNFSLWSFIHHKGIENIPASHINLL